MDYVVHGVAKSWTRLNYFHFHFNSINFLSITVFAVSLLCPKALLYGVYILSYNIFYFPFDFWLDPFFFFSEACGLIYIYLWIYQLFFCNWCLVLYHYDQRIQLAIFQSYVCYILPCDLECNLPWRIFQVCLRRMCILLLLSGMPFLHYLAYSIKSFFLLISSWMFYPLVKMRYWNPLLLLCHLFLPLVLSMFASYI